MRLDGVHVLGGDDGRGCGGVQVGRVDEDRIGIGEVLGWTGGGGQLGAAKRKR